MAHRTISDEDLLAIALDLFRTYGFEGVSLKRLADATGLEKASLYYRYPDGKDEIAMAIARNAVAWFQANVFEPLTSTSPVRKRVSFVAERLKEFYSGGSKACLMDVLSIPGGSEELQLALRGAMQAWVSAFALIAKESGFGIAAARSKAEEAIIRIEGSLVVARVLGDTTGFERVLKSLPDLLTGA
ncbi:transcriptional regulator, putative [Acidisarcina polymorpha]|uniref:Transcriptional regulator, putative n=1 Tax=Acidisarcina polymorpha TaxID=2211140 RepID=A0A2Z5G6C7_9BACT|nr:TetR/AcrR family transcriptional regulator [Acidisarcina polymorpha]AXC14792.1 transcriptional regulator, putative [Acidisarcina polymorpha]